ncbi:NADP-dependent 3-hydroxy acid dehydrogenase YdfG [Streptomyces sp. LamerLS-316]|uniref:SDR family oxidoreductase n=1 Tax=unclassified Streptomyces TaxID=2593676 RepID=UPI000823E381|nr:MULTISPECIES: SDR family oxidoreductase [unclassified Streptomyces]MYQ37552.1 SDR family NAD(P)-dependent oxidoreductase [Streptomyces sp. SID4921]SCK45274.1 NADP-dependent 3-hydroxy acid dehydrogenase YdfG [Streptomyces sp. LamerLS-316]
MSGIDGKVVAITGASGGIGEATALLLAEKGARLVLGARRSERLAELVARIEKAGGAAVQARTDVTRRDDLHALVALAGDRFGRLDVLVNNAGAGTISPLDDLRVDEWDQMVDVNVKGVLHGIGAALPVFRAQGTGHFITVASTAAFRVAPAMAVYAGTKFAVRAICEGLRQEAGDSLRVTTVSPGAVATEFAEASTNPQVRRQITEMRDRIAIPPTAIAQAIAYAVEQPATVDVSEIVVRPTAQS